MLDVKRALISVSDKEGIVEFCKGLAQRGVELISTGGTAKALRDAGLTVIDVSEKTGFPEMLEGRVKTLHPKVHGGILARRDSTDHMDQLQQQSIETIDMVVCNLYPFEDTVRKEGVTENEMIENIDIGGPSMIRSAAKNHSHVAVVTNADQYVQVLLELEMHGGLSDDLLREMALEAFALTSRYDTAIYNNLWDTFHEEEVSPSIRLSYELVQKLRYGENPYNKASFYKDPFSTDLAISDAEQLHGKELSYNNILDLNGALDIILEFERPCAAVIKHTNPSGVACAETISQAFEIAWGCDSMSAFGSVIALNRTCDLATAELIHPNFIEVLVAPAFDEDAIALLTHKKKNRRLLLMPGILEKKAAVEPKLTKVRGGLLIQSMEFPYLDPAELKVVTETAPTDEQVAAMMFGVKVCRHIKSNTILLVKGEETVGIGAGQMSRVDSAHIAGYKAGDKAKDSVLISDAFFPFRDGIDEAAKSGVSAIIQPGGSIRDQEVIDAANEHGIAMVFSGVRLFKH